MKRILFATLLCCALPFMAAEAYPQSWAAWSGLGMAYVAKGDKLQAARMYEKSRQLNAQNEDAQKALSTLRSE